jgi:hypothetical protein
VCSVPLASLLPALRGCQRWGMARSSWGAAGTGTHRWAHGKHGRGDERGCRMFVEATRDCSRSPGRATACGKRAATKHGEPTRGFQCSDFVGQVAYQGQHACGLSAQGQGARAGHLGVGRQAFDALQAARVVEGAAEVGARGPDGDALMEEQGMDSRLILASRAVQVERGH